MTVTMLWITPEDRLEHLLRPKSGFCYIVFRRRKPSHPLRIYSSALCCVLGRGYGWVKYHLITRVTGRA